MREGIAYIEIELFEKKGFLSEEEYLKGTWLELKTEHPEQLKQRLLSFGVKIVEYSDKAHFYFQAPGGLVFRILALNE